MKKKHAPIPDFSNKKKNAGMRVMPELKSQQPPPATPRVIKPQATSSKSGRRGG